MDDVLKLGFLGGLQRAGIVPGLDRMRALVERLGHPQSRYPVIIVTGTNGKGSTTCFIDSILRAAGFRTGRFTSPHLVDVRERVFIDGRMVDAGTFARLGEELRRVLQKESLEVTFFEALSAIGFMAFAEAGVDVAVVEVGMGGRLDSTNVSDPVVSVLTSVGLDHTSFLGSTVEAIALEKTGVARPGRPFITGVEDGLYGSTVGPELERIGARPVRYGLDFTCREGVDGLDWESGGRVHRALVPGLSGRYQSFNLCLAVAAVEAFLAVSGRTANESAYVKGARDAFWPGRFQMVARDPVVILDGCHNVHGARALKNELSSLSRPLVMVHGTRPEKDYDGVLALLAPEADAIVHAGFEGGADPHSVAAVSVAHVRPGVAVMVEPCLSDAVAKAVALAGKSGTVLVTGSLYMIGAAIRDFGWPGFAD
ncbi:MAG TPA: folylpolyglutamate synthase/dihydrofolate synthase family protein [Myxococcota bacterium]|nr:folylpolyglutamate synthase/dihydrofolate synthase family protein [Myxococcota bacterium]HOA13163.1 folylpolyglutamate synthase/dihydrofolate synthase family protein [Myxococcota bacterium]HOC99077.1 folylpolyglutamate synthase/dihydrofolate synthase family protein [Myxococcota bacterium]HOH76310.1 folylpolyglutamate synthase/dihydrofolate synthase family protein [Myxococcota bacterium]HPV02947.1 folylpolyglutamate synthase/dihydrofolate synthase family protein [Myxococcota bacterium]